MIFVVRINQILANVQIINFSIVACFLHCLNYFLTYILKESALRLILSSSRDVRLSVCVCVRLSPPHAIFAGPQRGRPT